MGYRLIRRIVCDDKCIGYYVENNGKVAPVSLGIINKYVKSNKLENVAINSAGELYGINGFKIESLPVEQCKEKSEKSEKSEKKIQVIAINKRNGQIVSYELELNGKRANVKDEVFKRYSAESRINLNSIKTAKINDLDILGLEDLQNIYATHNLRDVAKKYIKVLDEVGEKAEKEQVLNSVKGLEVKIATMPMTEVYLVGQINQLKQDFNNGIIKYTEQFIKDTTNEIIADTEDLVSSMVKLNTRNTKLVAQDLMKIKEEIGGLSAVVDLDYFKKESTRIKTDILHLIDKVKKLLGIQEKEQAELDKTFKAIEQEVEKIAKDDELREQKIKILHEPWCLNNKAFLSSNKYLENCYLTDKENGKQVALSLARIKLNETFNLKGERTGFDVEYQGEKAHYNQILNNMNLLAAFIKLVEHEGLLSYCHINIVVESRGESRTIQLGVGE